MRTDPLTPPGGNAAMLVITLGNVKGGVEAYVERLSLLLRPHLDMYCLCLLPETAEAVASAGARAILLPQLGRWTKPLGFVLAFLALPRLLRKYGIRIVQVNGFLEAVFLLEARLLGRKAVYTRHGPFEDALYTWYKHPRRFLPRWIARKLARAASTLICVSEDTYQSLDRAHQRKAVVIPHWIASQPARAKDSAVLRQPPKIVCVCRLEQYKGVQLVIEAVRELPDVRLVVVGDGSYKAHLEKLSVGQNVVFVGHRKDPQNYLLDADVFVMPSFGPEGSSLAALEAMASGVPCILSDLPVYLELTASRKAAVHFRSGDVRDLQEKIQLVLGSEALRASLRTNAGLLLDENFHASHARAAYLRALEPLRMRENTAL